MTDTAAATAGAAAPAAANIPQPGGSAKTQSNKRRQRRLEDGVYHELLALPPPGGAAVLDEVGDLATWHAAAPVIDWHFCHPSLDPVQLLDNETNTKRKKGTISSQINSMNWGSSAASAASVQAHPEASTSGRDSCSGKLSRGWQKRWQVESFALVLQQLVDQRQQQQDASGSRTGACPPLHVVDFGCSSGSLLLPLAQRFPDCHFTGVEMKAAAVAIMQHRVALARLPNVSAYCGLIEEFAPPFDVGLALHACGNATDAVLLAAVKHRAAFIVSPCCVGKLKFSMAGGTSFSSWRRTYKYTTLLPGGEAFQQQQQQQDEQAQQTGRTVQAKRAQPPTTQQATLQQSTPAGETDAGPGGAARISGGGAESKDVGAEASAQGAGLDESLVVRHPRSRWMAEHLPEPERTFKLMAKVADTNHSGGGGSGPSDRERAATTQAKGTAGAASLSADAAQAGEAGGAARARAVAGAGKGEEGEGDDVEQCPAPVFVSREAMAVMCKLHVELDRCQAAREEGYAVGMFRLLHAGETAKGELLAGVPDERQEWASLAARLRHHNT